MSCTFAVGNSAAIRSSCCFALVYDSPSRSRFFGSPSSVEMVVSEREPLAAALRGAGWDVIPSQGNSVLGRPLGGDAAGVLIELRQQGILVRRFPDGDHGDRLRISIGTPEQNRALLAALGIGV